LLPTDESISDQLQTNIQTVQARVGSTDPIGSGITIMADLAITTSAALTDLGLSEDLPLMGTIKRSAFDTALTSAQRLAGMSLKLALPSSFNIPGAPKELAVSDAKLIVSDTSLSISASVDLEGAKKLFSFEGLSVTRADLTATSSKDPEGKTAWTFGLKGTAELKEKTLQYTVAFSKGADQKTEYAVKLLADDITKPLTVADVMGSAEPIPGLSDLGLTALILNKTDKGATQSATLTYQGKSATIEVLRKQGDNSPVVALSIDGALDFAKLIPGNALDGGSLTNLTMLIVPGADVVADG